jgi:hypothetical protein
MLNKEEQMRSQLPLIASVILAGLVMPAMGQQSTDKQNAAYEVEEIYVAHSTRISNTDPPTAFCDSVPFKGAKIIEAYFTWSSVQTNVNDGRLSNPAVNTIGDVRVCFGSTPDPAFLNIYEEGTIASIPFKAIGNCQTRADFPEKGVRHSRCFAALSGLPNNYVGGALLNNGITSQNITGGTSSPPGYLQSGLATFRLWKKRTSD